MRGYVVAQRNAGNAEQQQRKTLTTWYRVPANSLIELSELRTIFIIHLIPSYDCIGSVYKLLR